MKNIFVLTFFFIVIILTAVNLNSPFLTAEKNDDAGTNELNKKTEEEEDEDGPEEFAKFHRGIRTRSDQVAPLYKPGYKLRALTSAKAEARKKKVSGARTQSAGVLSWDERGPANVPGRTRGLLVDPDDATKNTWFVGSVSGGVWKTTDGGLSWSMITPDLPNLATTVLAMAESNHDVIYIGTGEGFGNADAVDGVGIFKSIDRGDTWQHLAATLTFGDVNRIVIDPTDATIILAACNDGIYRSADGGNTWAKKLDEFYIQDLKVTPGNFNIQYASQNGVGIFKSIDGGVSWTAFGTGLSPSGRMEIAISPVKPTRLFISAEGGLSGNGSDLYISDNSGADWSLVDVRLNDVVVDFLNDQGWYDNTIACHAFNKNIIYFGGVDLFQLQLTTGASIVANYTVEEDGTTTILALTNFSASYYQGKLEAGDDANHTSVEVRFGPGKSQKAHRFLVPAGSTSGVAAADYTYQDYVTVPFEVWDITNDRQLMVSFRDQGRDGQFNLITANTTSAVAIEQSREYIYINNVNYNATTPSSSIAVSGGHEFNEMFFFWPTLADGGVWPPTTVGTLRILESDVNKLNAETTFITDARGELGDASLNDNVHPDHHNIVMIPMTSNTFKILNANDGGVFISNTSTSPGIADNTWTATANGYNSSQFYGADKKPGANEYFGGMQDNGTWVSPSGVSASASTKYRDKIGGDGFEVLWNNLNSKLLIGGSQGNDFARSINGGQSFNEAIAGLTGEMPFISKLANSKNFPNRIFTVGADGVFVSQNFGESWTLKPITANWGLSTFMDIEVSRANANVIWAGSGMSASQRIYYSNDGGETFQQTNNYTTTPLGFITKLASHPTEENTAYALFSFANSPKILRTTNAGQSWEDISGFGTGSSSTTGFPNVAVYCLYVRPDNTNIIWAGTEIGIVESIDNGATWALLTEDFPNVSVWDMKGQDNQIIIATHGRGIWTATLDQPQVLDLAPTLSTYGTSPQNNLVLRIDTQENYDSVEVYANAIKIGTAKNLTNGQYDITVTGVAPGSNNLDFVAYTVGSTAPYQSKVYSVYKLDVLPTKKTYSTYLSSPNDLTIDGLTLQNFTGTPSAERKTYQTNHPYSINKTYSILLRTPVEVSSTNPLLYYSDIAIVEPGAEKDSVILEATQNGIDWIALAPGYNASASTTWQTAYTNNQNGTRSMFEAKEINISNTFAAGDTLLFRLRVASGPAVTAWGWGGDYITIQEEPLAVEKPLAQNSLTVYPNPTAGLFTVQYTLTQPSDVKTSIIDMFGRIVAYRILGKQNTGENTEPFNLADQQNGTYIFVLDSNQGKQTTKVVLKR